MTLRPVEQVLLQTLNDIDPKQAERLTKELYGFPKAREHALVLFLIEVIQFTIVFIHGAIATLRHFRRSD